MRARVITFIMTLSLASAVHADPLNETEQVYESARLIMTQIETGQMVKVTMALVATIEKMLVDRGWKECPFDTHVETPVKLLNREGRCFYSASKNPYWVTSFLTASFDERVRGFAKLELARRKLAADRDF